jgi:heterodisulfide reductase subunit A
VQAIEREGDKLVVRWGEGFAGQPSEVKVDLVVLATGFEPQEDAGEVAHLFGISRSRDGYFLERHPKLAPVETATAGVFLAGACQGPKDIPDSVAQAGGAAAAALALMDQGTIELDACVAEVIEARCAACGQCVQACPYGAVTLEAGVAAVNAYLCKGCGTCAAACPNKAMTLIHYDDEQIIGEMIGALMSQPVVPGLLSR